MVTLNFGGANKVHYGGELMVFTVTSSDCKVKKARFYEFLFTLG